MSKDATGKRELRLRSYIMRYPKQFALQAAGGIVYNTLVVLGAVSLGHMIDAANLISRGEAQVSLLYQRLLTYLGVMAVVQAARYFKRYYMREIENRIKCDIRRDLLDALFATPLRQLSGDRVGDMMSRMIGDVEQVGQSVKTTVTELWDTIVLMISYFTACMIYSPRITLLAAIPIPFAILAAELMRHVLYRLSQRARKAASQINIHLQHNVSGIALLRLFGLEDTGTRKFETLLDEQLKWSVLSTAIQNGMMPLYTLLAGVGIVLVVGFGGEYVVGGVWTIGMFTAYLQMFSSMATRTNSAAKVMNTWHGAKASWDRIREKTESESPAQGSQPAMPPDPDQPALRLDALRFRYPFAAAPSLTGITFQAEKGQIIGITGPVGSGKSALAAVLSGLYSYEGTALVYGVPLDLLGDARSDVIAYMDADHFIFSDDVDFNITLNREEVDAKSAIACAALEQDIAGFDEGMHTRLMERGVRVSGGQKQRICLARAWGSQAKILLLDDPFSAIDVRMEQEIMQHMRDQLGDRTILLFSHRLSTFDQTDCVVVLEQGAVSQMGTHKELLGQEGLYKDIHQAQTYMREGHYESA